MLAYLEGIGRIFLKIKLATSQIAVFTSKTAYTQRFEGMGE
jgi:hypothetical protein